MPLFALHDISDARRGGGSSLICVVRKERYVQTSSRWFPHFFSFTIWGFMWEVDTSQYHAWAFAYCLCLVPDVCGCMFGCSCLMSLWTRSECFHLRGAGVRKEAAELYAWDQGPEAGPEHLCWWEWRSPHSCLEGKLYLIVFITCGIENI